MIRVESPFPAHAIPRMWDWMKAFGSWRVTDDFGPQDRDAFINHWEQQIGIEGFDSFGVYRDGELGGAITIQRLNAHLAGAHLLFKKSFFGFETTIPAVRHAFNEVFQSGIGRIEANVFEDNASILGMTKKLGAVKEGTLRNRTIRNGRPISLIILGLLKEDFYQRIEEENKCHLSPSVPPLVEPQLLLVGSEIAKAPPKPPAAVSAS